MAEEAKTEEERARADAEAGEKLDKILECVDSLNKRMDAMEEEDKKLKADRSVRDSEEDEEEEKKDNEEELEKEKGEPEKVAADEESEEEKEKKAEEETRADRRKRRADARRDAEREEEKKEIADAIKKVEAQIPRQLNDEDYAKMSDAQHRADKVCQAFGDSAPRPLGGEDPLTYRRRMANKFKEYSPKWKAANLASIKDDHAFSIIEDQIYADALEVALHPIDVPPGMLREVIETDKAGRKISTFVGDMSWMHRFSTQPRKAKLTPPQPTVH